MPFGQSDVEPLRRVLVKHARDAFADEAAIDREWRELSYLGPPDRARAIEEYDRFADAIRDAGSEILFLPADDAVGLDSIYPRDIAVTSDRGMILCSPAKPARRTEPAVTDAYLREAGIPIRGRIAGDGRLEGGDVVWLDDRTIIVGRGPRTNDAGIRQLREILGDGVDELITVPLPDYRAAGDVFHLMSIFSPIDRDLALVYPALAPAGFLRLLIERGVDLVQVPDEEFETMGCNVLALAPRVCLALDGNPETRRRLETAGARVHVYEGREISLKGCGGPTCLTRPIVRGSETG